MDFRKISRYVALAAMASAMFAVVACGSDDEASSSAADEPAESLVPVSAQATVAAPAVAPAKSDDSDDSSDKAPAAAAASDTDGIMMGGHLRYGGSTGFPPKWDHTQTSTWIALFHYGGRIWNGLLQFSPRNGVDIWNDMATDWSVSDDGLTYTFDIDSNLTEWHDGTAFDIDQIIYGYNRWKNPPEGIIQPRVGALTLIDSMAKNGSSSLDITLSEPFGDFLAETANGWHLILPQHILEANNNTIPSPDLMIGTGPMTYLDSEEGVSVSTVKNENYFRSDPNGTPYPYLDKVTTFTFADAEVEVAALRTQQLDAARLIENQFPGQQSIMDDNPGEFTFSIEPMIDVASIQLNNTQAPFDNIDARRAVFYGVNRARIIEFNGKENPVNPISWFSNLFPSYETISSYPGYNLKTRDADVAAAKAYAEAAGLTEFDLVTPGFRVQDAELIAQDMMECCNVKVNISSQDWTTMVAAVEGRNYDAANGGTAPSYAGIIPVVDIMLAPGGGRNGGWDPPANWMTAWSQAKAMQPGADRDALFAEMERIQLEEWVPTVPYYGVVSNKSWWHYVHNMANVAQELFSNNKYEDLWLDADAPEAGN
jgi:ABC-type transport system substrate-binding protein